MLDLSRRVITVDKFVVLPLIQSPSSAVRDVAVGMGGTQNFVHGIYREKIPRYRVYRGTCFVVVVAKAKHTQQSN